MPDEKVASSTSLIFRNRPPANQRRGHCAHSRSGSRHQTGSLTVIFDRCLDSRQAWPSVCSTPRTRVFGTASDGPQKPMVMVKLWGLNIFYFVPENHCRLSFFNIAILVEMGTSFCNEGLCCLPFCARYVCNPKVTAIVTGPLTAR